MGRSLLIAEPVNGINGKPVVVATAHFESLDSKRHRREQMEDTFELLGSADCEAFVVGDFNFDNSWTQEYKVFDDAGYSDVLSQFLPDSGKDSFTMFPTKRFKAWRPDKILYKGS
jgi:endonuclease/exonuclease/phosphatase family metal-dependent hydrolase